MTPQDFETLSRQIDATIESLKQIKDTARANAMLCPRPANLRPATPADLQKGAIVWYDDFDEENQGPDGWGWIIVDALYYSNEPRFEGIDGNTYGLDGAWVEYKSQ